MDPHDWAIKITFCAPIFLIYKMKNKEILFSANGEAGNILISHVDF